MRGERRKDVRGFADERDAMANKTIGAHPRHGEKAARPASGPSVLLPLPPSAPELNSGENIWDYLRRNFLGHCVWDTCEAIPDGCCDAWNALMANSGASPQVEPAIGHGQNLGRLALSAGTGVSINSSCIIFM